MPSKLTPSTIEKPSLPSTSRVSDPDRDDHDLTTDSRDQVRVDDHDRPEDPRLLVAKSGTLALHPVNSVCSSNLRDTHDEIVPALTVFDRLHPGEHGFIRYSVRPAKQGTMDVLQDAFTAMNSGEKLKKRGKLSAVRAILSWVAAWIVFSLNADQRGAEKPRAPWRRPTTLKPQAKSAMTEREVSATQFAKEKVNDGSYYEARLYIGAFGSESRKTELHEMIADTIEAFGASYGQAQTGQGFEWRDTDPFDLTIGLMNVEYDGHTILDSMELGEMAKVPDSQTSANSINVDYGKLIVNPKTPLVVHDPLDPEPGMIPLGEIDVGTKKQRAIGMPIAGLATHAYVCGTTGSGKSTLLEWMLYGLAKNNVWWPGKLDGGRRDLERGAIFVVDPHGEMCDGVAENVLAFAPERQEDIIIMDFGDTENPIGFNPLNVQSQADIESTTNAVKDMILKMLNMNPDSAPRAVNYTEQAVMALCEANLRGLESRPDLHLTLLDIPEFFVNPEFRSLVMQFSENMSVVAQFGDEGKFTKLGERQQLDHALPILRTFDTLSTKDSFGNTFGQSVNKIDFVRWIEERKIVLMKLPAITGGDAAVAKFIGAMVTPMLIGTLPKWGRKEDLSAFLVIDEFQNYAGEAFHQLLAQTRKYGLWAIAVNQVPQDLPSDVLRGIQENTQTKFAGRLSAQAVGAVASSIAGARPYPKPQDIVDMDSYWFWANVKYGSENSGPFAMKGLAPPLSASNPLFGHLYPEAKRRSNDGMQQVLDRSRLMLSIDRATAERQRRTHIRDVTTALNAVVQSRKDQGYSEGNSDFFSEGFGP